MSVIMAKSQVQVSYDLSSEEEDKQGSDTTAESEVEDNGDDALSDSQGDAKEEGSGSNDDNEDGDEDDEDEDDMDGEDEDENDGEEHGEENTASTEKSGLADVMAKILRKQAPVNKPVILSKGLTDKELRLKRKIKESEQADDLLQKKKPREDESSDDDHNPFLSKEERLKKKAWEELGRRKIDITQREQERRLQRVATKGVLQLFNAVRKQQKMIEDKLRDVGSSERRKDDVMKSLSKGEFLDMLKTTPNVCDEPIEDKKKKLTKKKPSDGGASDSDEDDDDEGTGKSKPSWSILRDDFMMGAKMKDWDKEDDDEGSSDGQPDDDVMSSEDES